MSNEKIFVINCFFFFFSVEMKSSWTEFCENVKKHTASCGQKAADEYIQNIGSLHSSYSSYDVNALVQTFRRYLKAGYGLCPHIEHTKYKSGLKKIMDSCEALLKTPNLSMDHINEFIQKSHAIVVGCRK